MKRMLTSLAVAALVSTVPLTSLAADIVVTKEGGSAVTTSSNQTDTKSVTTKNTKETNNSKKNKSHNASKNESKNESKDTSKNTSNKTSNLLNTATQNAISNTSALNGINYGVNYGVNNAANGASGIRPIIIKSLYGTEEPADEVAFKDKNALWIPLDVYKSLNLNPMTVEKGDTYITLPLPRVGGDMLYSGDVRQGTSKIKVPVSMRNGIPYVDLKTTSGILGVTYTERNDGIILQSQVGAVEKPDKKEIKNSVTLVFDPLPNSGTPYAQKIAQQGTSVVAPTLFDLSHSGVTVKNRLNLDYAVQYKDNGYQVWPLVTNTFNPDFTSKILQDENSWKAIGRDLVLYALAYGYEGYNFDFENVNLKDKKQLTKFVTYLSDLLHSYNIKSSIDVTGYSDSPNWSLVYDRKALSDAVDYVVLMAYDETWASSTQAGPVASYPWVRRNVEALKKEVPSHKIILGVPYYMRIWTSRIAVNGKGDVVISNTKSRTLPMEEAESIKSDYEDRVIWDKNLKVNYVAYGNDELGDEILAYKASHGNKAETVQATGTDVSKSGVAVTNSTPWGGSSTGSDGTSQTSGGRASVEEATINQVTSTVIPVTKETDDTVTTGGSVNVAFSNNSSMGGTKTNGAKTEAKPQSNPLLNKSSTISEVWFEDEQSMALKLSLVDELQLGGFGAWRKGFETDTFRNFVYTTYREPVADSDKETEKSSKGKTKSKR